jgi:hypothetical protein
MFFSCEIIGRLNIFSGKFVLSFRNTTLLSFGATEEIECSPPSLLRFLDHTKLDTRTYLNEWSARRRVHYQSNTQQTEETRLHDLSKIRTRYPSNRVAADLRRRQHSNRGR